MKNNLLKTVSVNASKKYDVLIGKGLIDKAGEKIKEIISPCKCAIITDDVVDNLYSERVINSLKNSGFDVVKFVFKNGEESKNILTLGEILEFLAENELTRTDLIVALGGGVVGDISGFSAGTYLRGIKYVQIPTTLLAGIDSSVGGKTAIDLMHGKNLAGVFYQPSLVICDVDTFSTLPSDVLEGGMGEVSKYVVLDKNIYSLIKGGNYDIEDLVYLSVDYKKRIVEADEFEGGMRKLLNFGHTIAHGIERLSEYKIPHGIAVAMGVRIILEKSLKHGYIDTSVYQDLIGVVDLCVSKRQVPYKLEDIATASLTDKKRKGEYISFMMAYGVGDVREVKVNVCDIKEFLK